MREIKFRAWNEQIKFMGEVRNIDFINGTVEVLIEDNNEDITAEGMDFDPVAKFRANAENN